ncbi:hypothetical protein D9M69_390060 [compost metagenome]
MRHQGDAGAGSLPRADRIAGVAGRCRAPAGLRRLRQVLLAHGLAALEAAGGQDHAMQRADFHHLPVLHGTHTADRTVFDDQVLQRGIEPQRDRAVHHRPAQATGQAVAKRQPAVAPGLAAPADVEPVACKLAHRQPEPARRAAQQRVRLARGHGHAASHQRAGRRRTQPVEFFAQARTVERHRVERAVARHRAGQLLEVVGVARQRVVMHAGLLLQVLQHARRLLEVGADPPRVAVVAGAGKYVLERLGVVVLPARRCDMVVERDPDAAAGHRRGAAVLAALLQHHH